MWDMTVLIACKDRDFNIAYCLASINQSKPSPPPTVLVDFGSKNSLLPYKDKYSWLRVVRAVSRTELFHKSRALNIGLKHINTSYLCATDADQVFNYNFFQSVRSTLGTAHKLFVMCHTHFLNKMLPMTPDALDYKVLLQAAKVQCKRTLGDGCCNGVSTKWVKSVHGWDERYIGYGAEDSDMMLRAKFAGYRPVFIHNKTNMVHLPHPKSSAYYSKRNLDRNRAIFGVRKKKKDIVVNAIRWGVL